MDAPPAGIAVCIKMAGLFYSMHNLCAFPCVFFSLCNNSTKTGKKESKPLYREQGEESALKTGFMAQEVIVM